MLNSVWIRFSQYMNYMETSETNKQNERANAHKKHTHKPLPSRKSFREMANNFSFSCVELLNAKSHHDTFAYYTEAKSLNSSRSHMWIWPIRIEFSWRRHSSRRRRFRSCCCCFLSMLMSGCVFCMVWWCSYIYVVRTKEPYVEAFNTRNVTMASVENTQLPILFALLSLSPSPSHRHRLAFFTLVFKSAASYILLWEPKKKFASFFHFTKNWKEKDDKKIEHSFRFPSSSSSTSSSSPFCFCSRA